MKSPEQFDFSKKEDQEEFNDLPENKKTRWISKAHDEANEIDDRMAELRDVPGWLWRSKDGLAEDVIEEKKIKDEIEKAVKKKLRNNDVFSLADCKVSFINPGAMAQFIGAPETGYIGVKWENHKVSGKIYGMRVWYDVMNTPGDFYEKFDLTAEAIAEVLKNNGVDVYKSKGGGYYIKDNREEGEMDMHTLMSNGFHRLTGSGDNRNIVFYADSITAGKEPEEKNGEFYLGEEKLEKI